MAIRLRASIGALLAAVAGAATATPGAAADGLPVPFDASGNAGVTVPGEPFTYSTATAGGDTAVLKIARDSGEIDASNELQGIYGVPLVAYDATASGLSADGRTLALIQPRNSFPRAKTKLAILDTRRLAVRDELTLRGDFSFDALSPDGRTMYLIGYPQPRDPTAYEVRAYDLERERLLPGAIVDPNEPDEEMAGWPQTRAVGLGGRWAYTLYAPPGGHHPPFVHALDTVNATAVCIDLDPLADTGPGRLGRLALQPSPDGTTLGVLDGGETLATVDLESFEVGVPPPAAQAPAGPADDAGGAPWPAIALGLAALGAAGSLGLLALRRRRRRGRSAELSDLVEEPKEREWEPVR